MKHTIALLLFFCASITASAQIRSEILLEKNWKFSRIDLPEAVRPEFNDAAWQSVRVPHDWAAYGPFDGNADLQKVAITQDGETQATMKSGRTGGLPFIGVGWYRTRFDVPGFDGSRRASICFDGAMSNARIWLNGQEVGFWPYGYNSFWFDVSPYVKEKDNVLAVRLENLPESSRWYPGAGLYRNVRLTITSDVYVPVWGTLITTKALNDKQTMVKVNTKLVAPANFKGTVRIVTKIIDETGNSVSSSTFNTSSISDEVTSELSMGNPHLWSPESPYLYKAVSEIFVDDRPVDLYETRFGVRTLEIVPNKGMFLNGEPVKFRGVCNHHDLGPLGAAVNRRALQRQLEILKDMGCNAIRTAHNMPAPELVELCDEMGFMMMVEAFDEWNVAKCKNGYNLYFDQWAEKDLVNMIRQFRNNASVVMWSIGNEVPGQHTAKGMRTARDLQAICHREDPTRPVTMGIDNVQGSMNSHMAAILDVAGFTYRLPFYRKAYAELPQEIVLGSETASTISSRGVYHFPVVRGSNKMHDDNQCSGYDVEHCSWSNLPDDDFAHQDDYPWCIGEFVWTGFDYLGEPTPYGSKWPNHSSMFGIIDLAGIPKDRYYLYRSHWNPSEETLHILPHWTWPGREGQTTPVFVYTNHPSAELFINGKSQGRLTKDSAMTVERTDSKEASDQLLRLRRYRLMWMDAKYEPGTIKVIAYNDRGEAVAEREVRTAGKPHHIELAADRTTLAADGRDLAFITARIVDRNGNLCPDASHSLRFKTTGAGTFEAVGNGDPTNLEQFHLPRMSVFKGQLVAIVRAGEKEGSIRFEAEASGLAKGTVELKV
ncbi:MAG: DUF4982 domain-containing protein, partial [Tannerellaceae bacterium]|nr:DUF4982 domain-containing protein [Tannerellaceae bacterium]